MNDTPGRATAGQPAARARLLSRKDEAAHEGAELPGAADNPFLTDGYARYRAGTGESPVEIRLASPVEGVEHRLAGFIRRGRTRARLEIPSLPAWSPAVAPPREAWSELARLVRSRGVTDLQLGTFASPAGAGVPVELCRASRRRTEYVLSLHSDIAKGLASGHRRNARRGAGAGLSLERAGDPVAHARLVAQSLGRRRNRGETTRGGVDAADAALAVRSGAAEIFQARAGDAVLSSLLVLRAPRAAYYQSAGTSPDGMASGASHWLVLETASHLRADGVLAFNLGGAGADDEGLHRFKRSFGAIAIDTTAGSMRTAGPGWRLLLAVRRLVSRAGPVA